jgi:proline iminopeptidase
VTSWNKAPGVSARQHRVPAGNAELYVREVGQGLPVVILHGGPSFDHRYLIPEMDNLSDSCRLIYYDQRGRGFSAGGVRSEDVTIASEIADIDAVRQDLHIETTALLGHSFGALLALEYALLQPQRVTRLVLVSPAPASAADWQRLETESTRKLGLDADRESAIESSTAFLAGDPDAEEASYRIWFRPAFARSEDLETFLTRLRPTLTPEAILRSRAIAARLFAETLKDPGYNLLPKLKRLKVPTLVIQGDHEIVPPVAVEHIRKAIPNARLVTLNNCGHFPYLERPTEFRSEVAAFLKEDWAPGR